MRKRLATAGLALWAFVAPVAAQDEPLTLKGLRDHMDALIAEKDGNADLVVEDLSVTLGPPDSEWPGGEYVVTEEPDRRVSVVLRANAGKCGGTPNPNYLSDLGFYLVEYCDNSAARNLVWSDIHRLANSSGGLGRLIGSEKLTCSKQVDYIKMPVAVRSDFCRD